MPFIKFLLFRIAISYQGSDLIERNEFICIANHLTGFYVRRFARFGTVCPILKMYKTPMEERKF